MSNEEPPGPVVVGIDGSDAALGAAQWAVKEAIHVDRHDDGTTLTRV
ncbi:hypothetical protein [Candidatus Mycobacterium methanotrophicum]